MQCAGQLESLLILCCMLITQLVVGLEDPVAILLWPWLFLALLTAALPMVHCDLQVSSAV